jgi:hypothetical protein
MLAFCAKRTDVQHLPDSDDTSACASRTQGLLQNPFFDLATFSGCLSQGPFLCLHLSHPHEMAIQSHSPASLAGRW